MAQCDVNQEEQSWFCLSIGTMDQLFILSKVLEGAFAQRKFDQPAYIFCSLGGGSLARGKGVWWFSELRSLTDCLSNLVMSPIDR